MTIQTLWGGFPYPGIIAGRSAAAFANTTLSATAVNNSVAFTFQAPVTGTITGASVWVTANNSGFDLRLETTAGSGATSAQPSGTLATTNTLVTFASGTGVKTGTFTGSYNATAGEYLGLVLLNTTTTITVSLARAPDSSSPMGAARAWQNLGGTYTPQSNGWSQFALNYGGTYYWIPGAAPISGSAADTAASMTQEAERGIQFQVPFPARVRGWYMNYSPLGALADYMVTLYDNSGGATGGYGALLTASMLGNTGFNSSYGQQMQGIFATTYDLAANTTYNLAIRQLATTALRYHETTIIDTGVTAIRGAFQGGLNTLGINRTTTTSAFTTSSTQFSAFTGVLLDGFDDAAGSTAYMIVHPGLAGGARG